MRRGWVVGCVALFLNLTLPYQALAQAPGTITTFAGGGPNNVPAVQANVASPTFVAVGSAGDLFVASLEQHRVFKVDTAGRLTVFAGVGAQGCTTGQVAPNVHLFSPDGIAFDADGHVFIADSCARVVRVDVATGIATQVAGVSGPAPGFSGDGGPATSARLRSEVMGLAFDRSGNLYIADLGNRRVRRVSPGADGRITGAPDEIITTVAGNGVRPGSIDGEGGNPADDRAAQGVPATSTTVFPYDLTLDGSGNLYVSELGSQRVRRVSAGADGQVTGAADEIITIVAGNGGQHFNGDGITATAAAIDPRQIFLDADLNLFIADRFNGRVRRVDPSGVITTIAGRASGLTFSGDGGPATSAILSNPFGVALDRSRNIYIADTGSRRVRRVDAASGIINTVAGNGEHVIGGDGGPATNASFAGIAALAVAPDGDLVILGGFHPRVRRVDAATGIIATVAGGSGEGFSGDGGPATGATFRLGASGVAVDRHGHVYVADTSNARVRRIDAIAGIITTVAGNGTAPGAIDGEGGDPADDLGDGRAATAVALVPRDVAVDAAGNLFILSGFAQSPGEGGLRGIRVRRVSPGADGLVTGTADEIVTTVAGTGDVGFAGDGGPAIAARLANPFRIEVDGKGDLYIADFSNIRVRRVGAGADGQVTGASDEIITTVAGNGLLGSAGDGGPATQASLGASIGIAFDSSGNLYIGDINHSIVRRVSPGADGQVTGAADEIITTVAGTRVFGFAGDGGPATGARLTDVGDLAFGGGSLYIVDRSNERVRRVVIENTTTGSGVVVQPVDSTTATTPVTVEFGTVTDSGVSSVTTSTTGPPPPSALKLGNPPTYYQISTTADVSGPIKVCVSYAGISFGNELNLRLMHFEDTNGDGAADTWVDRTSSHDPVNDIICATVPSLSFFAIFEPRNAPPIVSLAGPTALTEGATGTYTASASDPDGDALTFSWALIGPGSLAASGSSATYGATEGPATATLRVNVSDGRGGTASAETTVNVANAAPLARIAGPPSAALYAVNSAVTLVGSFTDAGTLDTHTGRWTVGANTVAGVVNESAGSGSVTATHTPTAAGVYPIRLSVNDDDGGIGESTEVGDLPAHVIVYDPDGGYITGGGWIDTPPGAYGPDPALAGRTSFGFVSKYLPGRTIPSGETEFRAAGLTFKSTAYDWLVVSGARAQYRGTGSLNGTSGYDFMLTVIDGDVSARGSADRFRIKISRGGVTVYDSQLGASDAADPATAIRGGSIVIHR